MHSTFFPPAAVVTVKVKDIPYFPPQGKLHDLYPNGGLLSDEQLKDSRAKFAKRLTPADKQSKRELNQGVTDITQKIPFSMVEKNHEPFTVYTALGGGSCGKARLAQHSINHQWFLLKSVDIKPALCDEETTEIKELKARAINEFQTLEKHKANVGAMGTAYYPNKNVWLKWNYMSQLVPGYDLELLRMYGFFDAMILHICIEFVRALRALHTHPLYPIFHGDLKLANIMFDPATKNVKLIDFDFSLPFNLAGYQLDTLIGNFLSNTPEMKRFFQTNPKERQNYTYNLQSEIHAIGICLADMLDLMDIPHFDDSLSSDEVMRQLAPTDTLVAKETSNVFLKNNRINDIAIRRKALQFIERITSGINVPSLDEIEAFLVGLKQECIASPLSKKMQAVIFDVDVYMTARSKQLEILKALKAEPTEVCLIDNKERDDMAYMRLLQEMHRHQIYVVSRRVLISSNKDLCTNQWQTTLNASPLQGAYTLLNMEQLVAQSSPKRMVQS